MNPDNASVLIVNTLSEEKAQEAIDRLTVGRAEYRVIHTEGLHIRPCIGCNSCWLKTPGVCAVHDGYEEILKAYLQYDVTVFLAETALGFVDHRMKNLIDRLLPLVTMYTCIVDGQCRHVPRYDKKYRFGLLYDGEADKDYLNEWFERVMLNFGGVSLGAYPIEESGRVLKCRS